MAIVMATGVAISAWYWRKNSVWTGFLSWMAFGCALAGTIFLAMSGSRAAVLAGIVSLLFLSIVGFVRWTSLAAVVGLLLSSLLFTHHAVRFGSVMIDNSSNIRIGLWHATLALIRDHPLVGVSLGHVMPILDRWYVPNSMANQFATALNEPLTIAAAYGIPTLACLIFVFIGLVTIGVRNAVHGSLAAALGVVLLIVHSISGQFQGHVFAWWQAQAGWTAGVICILISGCTFGWRCTSVAKWMCVGFVPISGFVLLVMILGDSPWKTTAIGSEILATPRHFPCTGLTAVIGSMDAPQSPRRTWIANRLAEHQALCLMDRIPEPEWWARLPSTIGATPDQVLAVATGASATALWTAWRSGRTGSIHVLVTDPDGIPEQNQLRAQNTFLAIRYATGAPFIDPEGIQRRLFEDGLMPAARIRSSSAAWWIAWP